MSLYNPKQQSAKDEKQQKLQEEVETPVKIT